MLWLRYMLARLIPQKRHSHALHLSNSLNKSIILLVLSVFAIVSSLIVRIVKMLSTSNSAGVSGMLAELKADYTSTGIKALHVKKCKYSTEAKIIDSQFVSAEFAVV